MNEDLQPLPTISEDESEPSVRMRGHDHSISMDGSLEINKDKASFAGKQLANTQISHLWY